MKEQELIFRIIEYSTTQKDRIIVKQKLIEALQLSDLDQQYVQRVLQSDFELNTGANINANHIMVRVTDAHSSNQRDWQYRILPTALNSYYDYVELKHARQNAVEARRYSIAAIIIALLSLVLAGLQYWNEVNKDSPVLDSLDL